MCKKIFILVFIFLWTESVGQSDSTKVSVVRRGEKHLSLLLGYNGIKNHFGEIGIAKNQLDGVGPHPLGRSYFVSTEMKIDKNTIIGPKVGGWFGGGPGLIAMGISTIYYTDFESGSWRFRPEVGLGLDVFKVVYGYNLALSNKDFKGINDHNFSLVVLLSVKKLNPVEK